MTYRDSAKPVEYARSKFGDAAIGIIDLAAHPVPWAVGIALASLVCLGWVSTYYHDRADWCQALGGEPVGMWTACVKPPEPQRCRRYRESTEYSETWHCTNEASR
jgi:hypothetical protein